MARRRRPQDGPASCSSRHRATTTRGRRTRSLLRQAVRAGTEVVLHDPVRVDRSYGTRARRWRLRARHRICRQLHRRGLSGPIRHTGGLAPLCLLRSRDRNRASAEGRQATILSHVFAWATVAYVLIASAGPETNARFRAPLMPILEIYTAYGLVVGREISSVCHRSASHANEGTAPRFLPRIRQSRASKFVRSLSAGSFASSGLWRTIGIGKKRSTYGLELPEGAAPE